MKYAIITGASRGIGLATAERFVQEGYQVINLARTPCPLSTIKNIEIDLSKPLTPEHQTRIRESLKRLLTHPIDSLTLVHNAGMVHKDRAQEVTAEQFAKTMQVNLLSIFELNQIMIPLMPHHQGSSIIYLGSTLSYKGVSDYFSYIVSKHGVLGMMRASAQDLKPLGIHSVCVCPSFTDTAMMEYLFPGDQIQGVIDSFGDLISPKTIAKAIFFAATTPECNGLLLPVDKGANG